MKTIEAQVKAIREAQAGLPAYKRETASAIEARLLCEHDGHELIIDGRCVRCRVYGLKTPVTAHIGETDQLISLEPRARCPHYTVDQGCPLHGETCTR